MSDNIAILGAGVSGIGAAILASNKNYNVLSIDLPGHGNSEGKSLKSIEEISNWLEKVFNELNISDLTIIGHSQGLSLIHI